MEAKNVKSAVASSLAAARRNMGLTQAELARRTGLDVSAISHFETGSRGLSIPSLLKLAEALDATTDSLLGLDALPGPDTTALSAMRHMSAENKLKAIEILRALAK